MLTSSSDDEQIIVWSTDTANPQYYLTGHENKVETLTFVKNQISVANIYNSDYSESFNKILSGKNEEEEENSDKQDNLSKMKELNKKLMEKGKNQSVPKINKEYIISCSRDKSIKIWDVFGSSCIYTILGHDNWVRNLIVHPNGKYIVSCSDDKSVRVWDLTSGRCAKKIYEAHEKFVVALAINSKYPLMASGSNDKNIKIWNCK